MKISSQISSLEDPIVAEIRHVRAELAREADYDLHTICERIREEERQHRTDLGRAPTSVADVEK